MLVSSRSSDKFVSGSHSDAGGNKKFLDTSIPLEPSDGAVRKNGRTVSSSAMHFSSKPKRPGGDVIGAALGNIGRSMSTEEGRRRKHRSSSTHLRNLASEVENVGLNEDPMPPVIEGETGLRRTRVPRRGRVREGACGALHAEERAGRITAEMEVAMCRRPDMNSRGLPGDGKVIRGSTMDRPMDSLAGEAVPRVADWEQLGRRWVSASVVPKEEMRRLLF